MERDRSVYTLASSWGVLRLTVPFMLALLVAALLLGACASDGNPEATTATSEQPVSRTLGPAVDSLTRPSTGVTLAAYVTGQEVYPARDVPMPEKGAPFTDPDFGTTIVRFTDKGTDGYAGPGIQNVYSKMDRENANGSLVVLRDNNADLYLYDANTGEVIRPLNHLMQYDFVEAEALWDDARPDVLYFNRDTEFRRYDVSADDSELIHDFKAEFPQADLIQTGAEGDASLDRRFWAFAVQKVPEDGTSYQTLAVICYDLETDTIVGRIEADELADAIDWVGMSMSGEYVLVGYKDEVFYTSVFSRDLTKERKLAEGTGGHGDSAFTADGREVYVSQNSQTDYISMTDLATGEETNLVALPFQVNWDIGLHVSGNCFAKPGWVLVSTYGAKESGGSVHSWMDNQIFMVELAPDPTVWRIAHTNAYLSLEPDGEKNYFAESKASINTSGTRIYFGSNWGVFEQEYSETYQVTLPDDWDSKLGG